LKCLRDESVMLKNERGWKLSVVKAFKCDPIPIGWVLERGKSYVWQKYLKWWFLLHIYNNLFIVKNKKRNCLIKVI
jgi:hypothetical protein